MDRVGSKFGASEPGTEIAVRCSACQRASHLPV